MLKLTCHGGLGHVSVRAAYDIGNLDWKIVIVSDLARLQPTWLPILRVVLTVLLDTHAAVAHNEIVVRGDVLDTATPKKPPVGGIRKIRAPTGRTSVVAGHVPHGPARAHGRSATPQGLSKPDRALLIALAVLKEPVIVVMPGRREQLRMKHEFQECSSHNIPSYIRLSLRKLLVLARLHSGAFVIAQGPTKAALGCTRWADAMCCSRSAGESALNQLQAGTTVSFSSTFISQ